MKRKPVLARIALVIGSLVLLGAGYGTYLFFMPHRDVQSTATDYALSAGALVEEYLRDEAAANAKYLDAEGESRVLEITGTVHATRVNQAGETVVVLREPGAKAGVSCTFTAETNPEPSRITIGDPITIKGVIRAGATYDDVLERHLDAVIEKSAIL